MPAVNVADDKSFRLVLANILQQIIYDKLDRQNHDDITRVIAEVMLSDIRRASAWTNLYSSSVAKDKTPYHRAIGYSFHPIQTFRSYEYELEHRKKIL